GGAAPSAAIACRALSPSASAINNRMYMRSPTTRAFCTCTTVGANVIAFVRTSSTAASTARRSCALSATSVRSMEAVTSTTYAMAGVASAVTASPKIAAMRFFIVPHSLRRAPSGGRYTSSAITPVLGPSARWQPLAPPGRLARTSQCHMAPNVLELTLILWLGADVAGIVGALTGLGGGIVIVPMLTLLFKVDMRYAIRAARISVIATSSGAAASYVREGYSNIRVGMFLEVATTAGALSGAFVAGLIPTSALAVVFGLFLL